MILPFLLVSATPLIQNPYSNALEIAQPVRLELTPSLVGNDPKMPDWDPFGPDTYLNWEPGKLYVAGIAPPGKDLVVSLDTKGDGWLVGKDNFEYRFTSAPGKPNNNARSLDATVPSAPVWRERPDLGQALASSWTTMGDKMLVRAIITDPGLRFLPFGRKKMKLRVDLIDSNADESPFLPRPCSEVWFDDHRTVALPKGMDSGVEAKTRAVIPGENMALRFIFHGSNSLGAKSLELKTLGTAEDDANRLSVVFPNFDAKGRAFVDYKSKIDNQAQVGYRIVRGRINFSDGPEAIMEASYRIAPVIDFNIQRTSFKTPAKDAIIRIPYVVTSYAQHSTEGLVHVEVPGYQIVKGDSSPFKLFGGGLATRETELKIPANFSGTIPVQFTGEIKGQTHVMETDYITIR